jgi:SOS response regulatory protein OraA/RecX
MIVCKLSNPSRRGMVAVYARGGGGGAMAKVATLDVETLARLGIGVGTVWDDALAARAGALSARAACVRDAGRIAGQQLVSQKRVTDRLLRKGHAPELVAEVVAKLVSSGIVNDGQLARVVAEGRAGMKRGARAIEQTLRAKGVSASMAKRAAADAAAGRDGLADATALASKRLAMLLRTSSAARIDEQDAAAKRMFKVKLTRRLLGFLQRRGHGYEVSQKAVEAAMKEQGGSAT